MGKERTVKRVLKRAQWIVLAGLLVQGAMARGASIAWTSGSGGNYGDLLNWNNGAGSVPGLSDGAVFSLSNTYTVTFNAPFSSDSFTLSAGDVSLTSPQTASTYSVIGMTQLLGGNLTLQGTTKALLLNAGSLLDVAGNSNLNIYDGNDVTAVTWKIASDNWGNGAVVVKGSGSTLSATGSAGVSIGDHAGAVGSVTYRNSAKGTITGTLGVGDQLAANAQANVSVLSSGALTAGAVQIGTGGGSNQRAVVSLNEGKLTLTGSGITNIGTSNGSTGLLEILDGGTFTGGTGDIVVYPTGSVVADGGDMHTNGNIRVTGGRLDLEAGGLVWSTGKALTVFNGGQAILPYQTALPDNASVTVSGNGSTLSAAGIFTVGYGSTINASTGGAVQMERCDIGTAGNGTLTVDGTGASIVVTTDSYWGDSGATAQVEFKNGATADWGNIWMVRGGTSGSNANVTVSSGAQITTGSLFVGTDSDSVTTATLTVTDVGTVWTIKPTEVPVVYLGADDGDGTRITLNINNGATFNDNAVYTEIATTGQVLIQGGVLNVAGDLHVAGGKLTRKAGELSWAGGHTLSITGGGTVELQYMAFELPALANVAVSGTGSQLTVSGSGGSLAVANGSALTVTAGGKVASDTSVDIGFITDGNVLVDGTGSSLQALGNAWNMLGYAGGKGTLTFSNGATGTLPGGLGMGNGTAGSAGTLLVQSGAMVTLGSTTLSATSVANSSLIEITGAGSTLTFTNLANLDIGAATQSSASLRVLDQAKLIMGASGVNTLIKAQIGAGNINLNATGTIEINGGDAALGWFGVRNGALIFTTGNLGFDGDLSVSGNTLLGASSTLNADRSLALGGTLTIQNNASMILSGGELSVSKLINNGTFSFTSGTLVLRGQELSIDTGQLLGKALTLSAGKNVYAAYGATLSEVACLTIQGGLFYSTSVNNSGYINLKSGTCTIDSGLTNYSDGLLDIALGAGAKINGVSYNDGDIRMLGGGALLQGSGLLTNTGIILGQGEISKRLSNGTGGLIYPADGCVLKLSGGSISNFGTLDTAGGTLQITGLLTNNSTGIITGHGTINAMGGITNWGLISLTGGVVQGVITNRPAGQINILGTTTFQNTINHNNGAIFNVASNYTVTFQAPILGTGAFTGFGTKVFQSGASTVGDVWTSGNTTIMTGASLAVKSIREKTATVSGTLQMLPSSGDPTVSQLTNLVLSGSSSKIDLTNNLLVVQTTNLTRDAIYATLKTNILSGRNSGTWNGTGIISSTAHDADVAAGGEVRGLALVRNDRLPTPYQNVGDVPVDGNALLIRYTWVGDTDVDGLITMDDYLAIDTTYLFGGTAEYWNGDFNYDGVINAADYALIDRAFVKQSGALAEEMVALHGAWFGEEYWEAYQSVPEPGSLGVLLGGIMLSHWRRRSRGRSQS